MKQPKSASFSRVETNEIVQPEDLNINNTLFGGRLVSWVDKIAAISAFKHSDMSCVTVSIDHLNFKQLVPQGSLITLRASVNRVFHTSLEVGVKVTMRRGNWGQGEVHVCSAYLSFVALDENGKKSPPPQILPESVNENRRYHHARLRREARAKLSRIYEEMKNKTE
jgi:acyl-CoA hydrolase